MDKGIQNEQPPSGCSPLGYLLLCLGSRMVRFDLSVVSGMVEVWIRGRRLQNSRHDSRRIADVAAQVMRRNRRFPTRGKVEPEEVCKVDSRILLSGDMLSDMAVGDTLPPISQDGLARLIQGESVNIPPLVYRGLS